jgi:hypothetical protein
MSASSDTARSRRISWVGWPVPGENLIIGKGAAGALSSESMYFSLIRSEVWAVMVLLLFSRYK